MGTSPNIAQGAILYSNGYNVNSVLNALIGRRRWRQPTRADFPFTLATDLVWGAGDVYSPVFESEHKVVTPYNIWVSQDDAAITSANFSEYLRNLNRDVILKCLGNVFDKKEHIEKKLQFERFGRQDYVNLNTGVFCGNRIIPPKDFGISMEIEFVALKFDSDVTFNLYLFHDTQPLVPITTILVTALANEQTVVPINQILSYAGNGNKSGVYYLGYFQEDLGEAQAINEIVAKFNNMYNFGCTPVELPAIGGHQINVNQISFTIKTHGMNIQMGAFRDFTQLIVDKANLFDNLIGMQMAADVIEMITNTTRTNKDQRITSEAVKNLYLELNLAQTTEEMPFATGLRTRILRESNRVKHEFYPKKKSVSISHDTDSKNIYGVPPPLIDVFKY